MNWNYALKKQCDTKIIYRNSTCFVCIYNYIGELKIKTLPNQKEVIICRDCYVKIIKENK
jgi:hypothetical protein